MTVLLSSLGVLLHYSDIIMRAMASQIISLSTVCLGTDQIKHQSSVSLAFVRGFHRSPVNSPHKGSVTRKMFPLDDVIMLNESVSCQPILWASTKPMITVNDNMNNEQFKHLFFRDWWSLITEILVFLCEYFYINLDNKTILFTAH